MNSGIHLDKSDGAGEPAKLGFTRDDVLWMVAIFGVLAGGLLGAAPWIARWLRDIPAVPFHAALDQLASFDQPWSHVARPALGIVLGVGAALVIVLTAHRLEVYDDHLVIRRGDDRRSIARDDIVGIHRDGKKIVIDGKQGRRIFADEVEAKAQQVRAAFLDRGYPYES
ncbi:YqeB family protein [Flexivirga sp. B27]